MNLFQGLVPEAPKKRDEKFDRKESLFNSRFDFIHQFSGQAANMALPNLALKEPENARQEQPKNPFESLKGESKSNLIASFLGAEQTRRRAESFDVINQALQS
jgi:hypothetical protein